MIFINIVQNYFAIFRAERYYKTQKDPGKTQENYIGSVYAVFQSLNILSKRALAKVGVLKFLSLLLLHLHRVISRIVTWNRIFHQAVWLVIFLKKILDDGRALVPFRGTKHAFFPSSFEGQLMFIAVMFPKLETEVIALEVLLPTSVLIFFLNCDK